MEAVKRLLAKGAFVDGVKIKNRSGQIIKFCTPYMMGAAVLNMDICEYLLEHGADGSAHDAYNGTALTYAMGHSHLVSRNYSATVEQIRFFVEHGADVNRVINNGARDISSPLLLAILDGRKDIYEYLLSVGADPKFKDEYGNTPEDYYNGKPDPRKNE